MILSLDVFIYKDEKEMMMMVVMVVMVVVVMMMMVEISWVIRRHSFSVQYFQK